MDLLAANRAFLAVSETESFTGAAKKLRQTTQLVSKQVRQLEERLGVRLFDRTTRSVSLTESGRDYLQPCRSLIDQFDEMEARVRERQTALTGGLRLTAPTGFGLIKLTPVLADFQALHPEVGIDLSLTDRRVSIVDERFDLAVRVGAVADSSLIQKRLMPMRTLTCAAPDYLARHGEPRDPQALATHECLVNPGLVDATHWRYQKGGEVFSVRVGGRFRADQPRALAQIAAMGRGIVAGPVYTLEPYLESGALVEILADYAPPPNAVYALHPSRRFVPARLRALIDFLAERFG
jgi:DNA-binding transcriptional LysR family regulator